MGVRVGHYLQRRHFTNQVKSGLMGLLTAAVVLKHEARWLFLNLCFWSQTARIQTPAAPTYQLHGLKLLIPSCLSFRACKNGDDHHRPAGD